ncbi:MAG TPA: amidohydrolase family protein [Caulobacteraceae bacterium]|nr:amidohydrolase family protein [Caulobacteraceae bacterium]
MVLSVIDIHPHIIADDEARYPRAPLFGVQSDWSRTRPVSVDGLIAAMDEAGVGKAAVVQASTCYGFDNSYVVDSIARYPGRLTAVCTVDVLQPDAPRTVEAWLERGGEGLRLFTGGSTQAFDASILDDPRSFPTWSLIAELGLSICIQSNADGLDRIAGLAERFPKAKIVLDHLTRPDVSDGYPYDKASALFRMASYDNVYLKMTPRILEVVDVPPASSETFFPRLIEVFGARRIAWGSNYPASVGSMKANLEAAKAALSSLSAEDQSWILAKTAQDLYPTLAN